MNFNLSSFLLTSNSFPCIKRWKSVNRFCICTLINIFICVTFILFLELKSYVEDCLSQCSSLVTLEVKVLFIYFNFWCNFLSWFRFFLFFFILMDFIIYFVLRDFVPVPSERNVFVAPQLGFYSAKIIVSSKEFYRKRAPSFSETFCFLFCSVLSVLFRVVCYYVTCYFRRAVFNLLSRLSEWLF